MTLKTTVFRQSIMSPALALRRYEALAARERSSRAWRVLAYRLRIAAAYALHTHDAARAAFLADRAEECVLRSAKAQYLEVT